MTEKDKAAIGISGILNVDKQTGKLSPIVLIHAGGVEYPLNAEQARAFASNIFSTIAECEGEAALVKVLESFGVDDAQSIYGNVMLYRHARREIQGM